VTALEDAANQPFTFIRNHELSNSITRQLQSVCSLQSYDHLGSEIKLKVK
jgi:hypothetical protein